MLEDRCDQCEKRGSRIREELEGSPQLCDECYEGLPDHLKFGDTWDEIGLTPSG